MKKFLVLLVILLLVVGGWYFLSQDAPADTVEDGTEVVEDVVEDTEEVTGDDDETVEEEDDELEAALDIYEEILDDENADSGDCAGIEDEEIMKTCEQRFIYEGAVAAGDAGMCDDLDDDYDVDKFVEEIKKAAL